MADEQLTVVPTGASRLRDDRGVSFHVMEQLHLTIEGMTCQHCVRAVEGRLQKTAGVEVTHVTIGSADVRYDPSRTNVHEIAEAIADEGYTAFQA
jgi:Copper chaperone